MILVLRWSTRSGVHLERLLIALNKKTNTIVSYDILILSLHASRIIIPAV